MKIRSNHGKIEEVELHLFVQGISILHTVHSKQGNVTQGYLYCPYTPDFEGDPSRSILFNATSDMCPPTSNIVQKMSPVVGTNAATIMSILTMVIWLQYRSTNAGILCLFQNKCAIVTATTVMSIVIILFSSSVVILDLKNVLEEDFGEIFWLNFGCFPSPDILCPGPAENCPKGHRCLSTSHDGVGWTIAFVNMMLIYIGILYSWIGSCNCCCCDLDESGPSFNPIYTRRVPIPMQQEPFGTQLEYMNFI